MENESLEVKTKEIKAAKQKLTSVFSLLEISINIWWKNIKKFVEIYLRGLFGLIPLLVVIFLFFYLQVNNLMINGGAVQIILFIFIIIAAVLFFYYYIRIFMATIILIKNDYTSAKDSFIISKKYFWGYIWISLLSMLVIGLWSVLLIVPGIIAMVYYLLVNYAFFFEDFKGRMSLARSKELVKGYWWSVFGRILFILLINQIVNLILSIPLGFMEKGGAIYSSYDFLLTVFWLFVSPIIVIYTYSIFRDLLKIKGESKLVKEPTKKQNIFDSIVIVILLVLPLILTISIISLNQARIKARDDHKIVNAKQLQIALEFYKNDNGSWPDSLEAVKIYIPEFDTAGYQYKVINDSYELCFETEQSGTARLGDIYKKGTNCLGPDDPGMQDLK
jgi:hypothetical protein